MTDPHISVLMPARNSAATIGVALRSTLRDLPDEAELLVLDDGSTDDTARILSSVRDPRLVVHRAEHPQGVAASLNTLLGAARAPLIGRMDADDITLPGRFAAQRAVLEHGLDMVFTTRVNFGSRPQAFRPEPLGAIGARAFPLRLAFENPLPHPSALLRRSTLEVAGGWVPGSSEDWELWLRMLSGGARGARIGRPGIGYRMHPGQVTRAPEWRAARAADPALRAAHTDLVRRLGWKGPDVWPVLFERPGEPDGTAVRRDFRAFLDAAGRRLPGRERRVLSGRLRRVLA